MIRILATGGHDGILGGVKAVLLCIALAASTACGSSSEPKLAKPDPLASVKILSGASQQGPAGTTLATPIIIQAVDSSGNPLSGLDVAFGPSDGSVNPASTTTDSTGIARTSWTLGQTAGQENLLASVIQGSPPSGVVVTDTVFATATP